MAQAREPLLGAANSFAEYAPETNPVTKEDVVILTTNEERDVWMHAPCDEAAVLAVAIARTRDQERHAWRGRRTQTIGRSFK